MNQRTWPAPGPRRWNVTRPCIACFGVTVMRNLGSLVATHCCDSVLPRTSPRGAAGAGGAGWPAAGGGELAAGGGELAAGGDGLGAGGGELGAGGGGLGGGDGDGGGLGEGGVVCGAGQSRSASKLPASPFCRGHVTPPWT